MHETQSEKTSVVPAEKPVAPEEKPAEADATPMEKRSRPTAADQRRERAAAKLRENLLRRKQQSRARRAGEADQASGLPAAKSDESS